MWLVGVVLWRYINFLKLLIPTPLVAICSFLEKHPCSFLNVFHSCSSNFSVANIFRTSSKVIAIHIEQLHNAS